MSDREAAAIAAIIDALGDLDRAACARVLKWAEDRYVHEHGLTLDPKWLSDFTEGMVAAARELGAMTPNDVMQAATAVYAQHVAMKETSDPSVAV